MKNTNTILQHYLPEEQNFVKSCLELQQEVLQNGRLKVTSFLSIREQEILQTIVGKSVQILFVSGIENGERKLALLSNYEITKVNNQVAVLKITYNQKFGYLKHGDVLGAILGLGLERKVVGDIVFVDDIIYVAIQSAIAPYILQELSKIGRQSVKVSIHQDIVLKEVEVFKTKTIYIRSLRLDNLVAHTLPCNREQAKNFIQKDFVQKNWSVTRNISEAFQKDDVVSIRKFGRIYVDNILETRKNRFKIEVRTT